eukprot:TRINITY_DN3804_c0_g1_i1.p1 TRINITY_DN3804_c0_g1~~TRINITY_DN3804_c0_g1_i1.p1  ORF type:complete len:656 (-),score=178.23 TRINITY_DN3804_c0_g1_i1:411-2378(-)
MEGFVQEFRIAPGKDPERFVMGGRMPAALLEQLESSAGHPPDITVCFEAEPPVMPDFPHVLKVDGKPYYFRVSEEQNHELYRQQGSSWTRDGSIVQKMFFYQDISSVDRQKYQEEKVKADKRQSSRKSKDLTESQEIQLGSGRKPGKSSRSKQPVLAAAVHHAHAHHYPGTAPPSIGVSPSGAVRRSPRVVPSDTPPFRPQSAPAAPTPSPVALPASASRPRLGRASESGAAPVSGWGSDSSDSKAPLGDKSKARPGVANGAGSNGAAAATEKRPKNKTANLTGKPLMMHLIHRMAVVAQSRPKLDQYARNPKEVGELLPRIATLKGASWDLKPEFFREVDPNWEHYSDTDRLKLRSRLSQHLDHIPSVEFRDRPQAAAAVPEPAASQPPLQSEQDVSFLFEGDDDEVAPSPGGAFSPHPETPPEPAPAAPPPEPLVPPKPKPSPSESKEAGKPYIPPRVTRQSSKDFTGRLPKGTAAAKEAEKEAAAAAPTPTKLDKPVKPDRMPTPPEESRRVLRSSAGLLADGLKRRLDDPLRPESRSKLPKTAPAATVPNGSADDAMARRREVYQRLKAEYDTAYPEYTRLHDEVEAIRRIFAKFKEDRTSVVTRDVDRRIMAAYKEHHQAFKDKSERLRVAKERVKQLKRDIQALLVPPR